MTDEETRLKALELAISSMSFQATKTTEPYSYQTSDKPLREIFNRADSLYAYVKDPNANTPGGIIAKLREVLA